MSIKETIRQLSEKIFHSRFWEKKTDDSEYQRELTSIRYGEKSLLTVGGDNQPMYQIIDLGDRFLFADMDDWHLITEFEPIPESVLKSKKNFFLPKKDITSVDVGVDYDEDGNEGQKLLEYAEIRLRWTVKVKNKRGGKTIRRFLSLVLTDEIEEDKLRAFFAGAGRLRLMSDSEFDKENGHILTSGDVAVRKRLLATLIVIPVVSMLLMFLSAALPDGTVLRVIVSVDALLPFVLFGMYMLFPRFLLIRRLDTRWDATKWQRTIDMDISLLMTVFAQFILCAAIDGKLAPFLPDDVVRWAAVASLPLVITASGMLLTVMKQLDEWKERLYTALLCLIYVFAASFGAVYLLNGTLDTAPIKVFSAQIAEKWTGEGYRGGEVYHIRTVRENGDYDEFTVFENEYESVKKGDTVKVEEYAGAFGISYKKAVVPQK